MSDVKLCIPFGLWQETHGIHQFFTPFFAFQKGIALKPQSLISLGCIGGAALTQ